MGKCDGGCVSKHRKGVLSTIKAYLDRNRLGELLVIKGHISPQDLKFALGHQKETAQPLGQIFIKYSMISRRQLTLVLSRQVLLRSVTATLFFMFAMTNVTGKRAKADSIKDVPATIAIAAPNMSAQFTKVSAYPGLFGSDEKPSSNLTPFTKWTGMFARFDRELKNGSADGVIEDWKKDLVAYQGLSLKNMAEKVNRLVNDVRYIGDNKNWGTSDYWATPTEFLKRGGDCEDFAIAKYTALRMLGVPESRMRVAIVHDNQKNIPHAVLVVYTDEGTYILDNQNDRMLDGDRPGRYRPIFSINRTAWWLHTAPSTTVIASR